MTQRSTHFRTMNQKLCQCSCSSVADCKLHEKIFSPLAESVKRRCKNNNTHPSSHLHKQRPPHLYIFIYIQETTVEMMRGRGRGRGAAGGFRGRGRGRGAAPPQQQPQQQQPGTQQQKQQNSTDSNFDDDPFSNIVGGGGAGKTSQTAQIPVLHKQASDHTVKRIGADAAEKYQPPPLYPVCFHLII